MNTVALTAGSQEARSPEVTTAGEFAQSLKVFLEIAILQRNERRRLPAEQWHPALQVRQKLVWIAAPPRDAKERPARFRMVTLPDRGDARRVGGMGGHDGAVDEGDSRPLVDHTGEGG